MYVPYILLYLIHLCLSTSPQLYFSWHNCPPPFYFFVSKFFPNVEIFEVFCSNISLTKLWMPSGKILRYHIIINSSWPNICIHSLEVAKVFKSAPSYLFRDTNYTKLFIEFLSSNTLFKSGTTYPVNHTFVSRC